MFHACVPLLFPFLPVFPEDEGGGDNSENVLDPAMAMEKSELVSKFGSFWASRRHYELATTMVKGKGADNRSV